MSVNVTSKIKIEDSRVMLQIVASFTDYSRGVIYNRNIVERLIEYLRASRMPALQCFILDLEKRMKLAKIFCHMQNIYSICWREETFCTACSRLGISSLYAKTMSIKEWTEMIAGSVIQCIYLNKDIHPTTLHPNSFNATICSQSRGQCYKTFCL